MARTKQTIKEFNEYIPEQEESPPISPIKVAGTGVAELVDGVFKSTGFVTRVSGWRIDSDGNAEFSTILLRNPKKVPGTILYQSADTVRSTGNSTPTKKKEATLNTAGTYSVYYEHGDSGVGGITYSSQIYVNGSAIGTLRTSTGSGVYTAYTENIAISNPGDTIAIYAWNTSGGGQNTLVRNFRLYVSQVDSSTITHDA
jgi:hypothetical protein